jgi:UDP-GlcNAc3NAcA epimerase
MKILTIIGARPQIIKAAAISRAIRADYSDRIKEVILHTGQHYDTNMSQVFFDEMEIPEADHNLNVGSDTHGRQTAAMMRGIEEMILDLKPDFLMLYGDTNSTLAGAVAGVKTATPVVHIEAGLRSFNKAMPEEINRITCLITPRPIRSIIRGFSIAGM